MWKYLIFFILLICTACGKNDTVPDPEPEDKFTIVDANATQQTQNLLKNLKSIGETGTMFGHQNSTLYGIGWSGDENRSDIKSVCGDNPAVYGWELGGIEFGWEENLDGELFADIRKHIIAAYERGGVNTISWHTFNPVTDGDSWDVTPAVKTIIPGGVNHTKYVNWLDQLALFMLSLEDSQGTPVPVIFRPFHEHTGNGFWWGKGNTTASEYIALWKFTVEYLRDTKNVHNLLYTYSPDIISSQSQYLEFWPGDDYVDILGVDAYDRPSWDYSVRALQIIRLVKNISTSKNKPAALTETGLQNNTIEDKWWTEELLKAIKGQSLAYVLIWRNASEYHFFGPYPGCVSEADFKIFAKDETILFESSLPDMY